MLPDYAVTTGQSRAAGEAAFTKPSLDMASTSTPPVVVGFEVAKMVGFDQYEHVGYNQYLPKAPAANSC